MKGPRTRVTGIAAWIALAGCALAPAGCGPRALPASLSGWNVLLVTLDTTRRDHLGCYGYAGARTPVLDDLAGEGVRFENAVAQCPVTLPAHSSLMTGLYPPAHGVRGNGIYRLRDSQDTLAEILRAAGYRTGAAVGAFVLDRRFGLAQGFESYDDGSGAMVQELEFTVASRPARDVTRAALRIARGFEAGRPYFLWVHYFDPHAPYRPPADLAGRFPPTEEGRYDGEIAAVDRSLGRLLDGLEALGLREHTVVVVVGDHGEGFPGPHKERTHGMLLYHDTLGIPFLVSAPGGLAGGRKVLATVRQVDVAPTLVELLEVPCGASFQGTSLAGVLRGGDPASLEGVPSYSETLAPWDSYGWSPLFSVRRGGYEFIEGPEPELYDLARDAAETRNLAPEEPERVRELRGLVRGFRSASRRDGSGDASMRPSAADLERLTALGYVAIESGPPPPLDGDFSGLPNPRDSVHLEDDLDQARRLQIAGKPKEAARMVEAVLREDPGNRTAWRELSSYRKEAGDLEGAERALRPLLERWPENRALLALLAEIQSLRSRGLESGGHPGEARDLRERAIENYRKAVEGESLDIRPMVNLGAIYLRLKRYAEAEPLFARARGIEPASYEATQNDAVALKRLGRLEQARAAAQRAAELAGGDPRRRGYALLQEAEILLRLGKVDEARGVVEALLGEQPGEPTATRMLERIRSAGGRGGR